MNLSVDLHKTFAGFRLAANFQSQSRRLGIFGPSGSGKSTLVSLLAGLSTPDGGELHLGDHLLYSHDRRIHVPPQKRRIALVFQQHNLFPHLGVEGNLLYGYKRLNRAERIIPPDELIDVLGLRHLLRRRIHGLSGGERQRVALGRAVLAHPRLLLMDEPLSALDEDLKYQIIPYLQQVLDHFNMPCIFISHSLNEMRLMTEEVVVLDKGSVTDQISPDQLARQRMGHSRVGYINLLHLKNPSRAEGLCTYRWGSSHLVLSDSGQQGETVFELSSKDIMLFKSHPEASSARNLLHCRISGLFRIQDRVGIELDCGGEKLISQVVPKAASELELSEGKELFAAIKASAFRRLI